MKHISVLICIAFVIGILLSKTFELESFILALPFIIAELLLRKKIPFIALFFLLGIIIYLLNYQMVIQRITQYAFLDNNEIVASGYVVQPARRFDNKTLALIKTDKLETGDYGTTKPLLVQTSIYKSQSFKTGDYVKFNGKIKITRKSDVNYIQKRIDGAVSVGKITYGKPRQLMYRFARWINHRTSQAASRFILPDGRALFSGMLFGDISEMNEEQETAFRRAGLTHLVAVSGSNLAMIIIPLVYMFTWLGIRKEFQLLAVLTFAFFYAFATGLEPPILRASVMTAIAIIGLYFLGRKNSLSVLSFTCLVLLVFDPFLIFRPSFLLSFASTLGLVVLMPSIKQLLIRVPGWLSVPLATTISAQILVIPVAGYFFGEVSVVSFIANVIAAPLVPLITNLGLISVILLDISKPIVLLAATATNFCLGALLMIGKVFGSIKWATLQANFNLFTSLVYFLIVYLFFLEKRLKTILKVKIALGVLFVIIACIAWKPILAPPVIANDVEVYFFDVGQGDGALIRTKEGSNVVIDTGKSNNLMFKHLKDLNINGIDVLLISHFDEDHAGGTTDIADNFKVSKAMRGKTADKSNLEKVIDKSFSRNRVEVIEVDKGQTFWLGKLKIAILHPGNTDVSYTKDNDNNDSVVAKFSYNNVSFLFTGDVEKEAQENIKNDIDLKSDVIKVPHHGAKNAVNEEFLKGAAPKVAIVSVGRNNFYGHPSKEYLDLLRNQNIDMYRTDLKGTIKVVSNGRSVSVTTSR